MLISPAVGAPLQNVGAAIRYCTSLTDREREIAILTVSVVRHSDFEWYAHERVGRRIGLTKAELSHLADGRSAPSLSPDEVTIWDVTRRLVLDRDLGDQQFSEAIGSLGQEKLAELVTLVGYYDHLALALRVWRTPLPAGVAPTFEEES